MKPRTSRTLALVVASLSIGPASFGGTLAPEPRSFDGTGNNIANPDWGASGTALLRLLPAHYADGIGQPQHAGRPGPREASNILCQQLAETPNQSELSRFVFQWGQFIDHDITLVLFADPADPDPIPVPAGDPWFDPLTSGTVEIKFDRSAIEPGTGISTPREHVNVLTAYIDGSQVYGSDVNRANELRSFVGGKMKVSERDMLPFNTNLVENFNENPAVPADELYLGGDVRVNEQAGLTAMHTLFVREHNWQCGELTNEHPDWTDEEIYQQARRRVGGLIQVITFREFLPALLGDFAPEPSGTYNTNINAGIATEFATALFRVGHTMISPFHLRIQNDNMPAEEGPLGLRDAFFIPTLITNDTSLSYILKGLAARRQEEIDRHVIDDLRSFLFGPPGAGGLDLPALNLQRARDHGLPDYNSTRVYFGLPPVTNFADISSDTNVQAGLATLYGAVTNIDLWLGAICENHLSGAPLGELLVAGISNQFTRLRDGDRFWYTLDPGLSPAERAELDATKLSDVIRRNTGITTIQDEVFKVIPEPEMDVALDAASTGMVVRWMARSNATYQVQATDDLGEHAWAGVGSLVAGQEGLTSMVDTNHSTESRTYRIRQYP